MIRTVITGGGIGGLATALALAQRGHRAVVLERAPEFAEIGAGIQLAPNGIHALDRLGVGGAARALAVRMDELRFMDGVSGEHVTSLPLTEEYQRRFRNPYVVVHRAELHALLLGACRAFDTIELRGGSAVTGYEQNRTSASAVLESGERVPGDALIGADGINSAVRAQLVGDGDPRVSGITVYRAVIPMERVPEELRRNTSVVWWTGPGCHFVHYPIAGGKHLNLAGSKDDGGTRAFAGVPAEKAHVRRQFGALGPDAQRLVELGEGWRSWMLVDRDPVDTWTDGRVTLLGDAAHPMLHYAAQGACQALEDAVHLGDLLEEGSGDDVSQRFEKYTADRRERTAAIQLAARESTRLWHPSGGAALARNALLTKLTPGQLHDQVAWMHGARDFGATTPAPAYLSTHPNLNGVQE